MSRMKRLFAVSLTFILLAQSPMAQEQRTTKPGTATVEESLSAFIIAFDNLDWLAFRECFSASATIFHPAAPNIRRIDAPEQFEKAWRGVFDRIKTSSGRNAPPYMDLKPLDLRVESLSSDVTLVTFHLLDGNILSRRTLVFRRESNGWKIVHIHASNLAMP